MANLLILMLCSSLTMGPLGHAKLPLQPFIHHVRLWLLARSLKKEEDQPDLQATKWQPDPVYGTKT